MGPLFFFFLLFFPPVFCFFLAFYFFIFSHFLCISSFLFFKCFSFSFFIFSEENVLFSGISFKYVLMLALVSELNCFLRSRCSMEMWCPDDIGRDCWHWVGPPAWGRACFNSPEWGGGSSPVKTEPPQIVLLLLLLLLLLLFCVVCCGVLWSVVECCGVLWSVVVVVVVVMVVVIVSDTCSTVCMSTAVMTMQQSLRPIGSRSPGSRDSRRPATPPSRIKHRKNSSQAILKQRQSACQIQGARGNNVRLSDA